MASKKWQEVRAFASLLSPSPSLDSLENNYNRRRGVRRLVEVPCTDPHCQSPMCLNGVHLKEESKFVCGDQTLKGEWEDVEKKNTRFIRLRCKQWKCSRCGPKKAKRVCRAIKEKATELHLSRFLTLTLNPHVCSPEDSILHCRKSWNKFRTYLKRKFKANITFISVIELQKSGYAHLHILVDRYIPQKWISEAWQAVGGGKIVYIKQVDIHRIAPYLSKYLTKEILLADFPGRIRRYTTSRDIHLLKKDKSGNWTLLKVPFDELYAYLDPDEWEEEFDELGELSGFRENFKN